MHFLSNVSSSAVHAPLRSPEPRPCEVERAPMFPIFYALCWMNGLSGNFWSSYIAKKFLTNDSASGTKNIKYLSTTYHSTNEPLQIGQEATASHKSDPSCSNSCGRNRSSYSGQLVLVFVMKMETMRTLIGKNIWCLITMDVDYMWVDDDSNSEWKVYDLGDLLANTLFKINK